MEAPDKIYLQVCGDCNDDDCKNCKFEDLEDNITWCRDKIFKNDVEYTRTDVFINKACDWIEDHIYEYLKMNRTWNEPDYEPKLIEDFRKAIKGE